MPALHALRLPRGVFRQLSLIAALSAPVGSVAPLSADEATPAIIRIGADLSAGTCAATIVRDRPLLHTAQVFPVDATGTVQGDTPAEQARHALRRLDELLRANQSRLEWLVRLHVYAASDAVAQVVLDALPSVLPEGHCVPITAMSGALPAQPRGATFSLEGVAVCTLTADSTGHFGTAVPTPAGESGNESSLSGVTPAGHFARASVLPPGDVVYISGQSERGETLEEATAKTLAGLRRTLDWLELTSADVVEARAFLNPIGGDLGRVREAFRTAFADRPIPACTFVEWTANGPSIEIEYVVSSRRMPLVKRLAANGGNPADPHERVAYLTPPWMTASPVFCRVTQVRRDELVYFGGFTGKPLANQDEVRDVFEQLRQTATTAGTDLRHLAKGTYFVARPEMGAVFGTIRSEIYDPTRPPAASKAQVGGIGRPGHSLVVDMIAPRRAD